MDAVDGDRPPAVAARAVDRARHHRERRGAARCDGPPARSRSLRHVRASHAAVAIALATTLLCYGLAYWTLRGMEVGLLACLVVTGHAVARPVRGRQPTARARGVARARPRRADAQRCRGVRRAVDRVRGGRAARPAAAARVRRARRDRGGDARSAHAVPVGVLRRSTAEHVLPEARRHPARLAARARHRGGVSSAAGRVVRAARGRRHRVRAARTPLAEAPAGRARCSPGSRIRSMSAATRGSSSTSRTATSARPCRRCSRSPRSASM